MCAKLIRLERSTRKGRRPQSMPESGRRKFDSAGGVSSDPDKNFAETTFAEFGWRVDGGNSRSTVPVVTSFLESISFDKKIRRVTKSFDRKPVQFFEVRTTFDTFPLALSATSHGARC